MITKRFQPWRISSHRAREFRRTKRHRATPLPMLFSRFDSTGEETPWLYLDLPSRKTRRRFNRSRLARCRPASRTAPFIGTFHSGLLRCVRSITCVREFYRDDRPHPRGRAPCSVAAHRLIAMGCCELPF